MANNKNLKFKPQNLEKLRKDPKVWEDLLRRGRAVARAAGGEAMGYKVTQLRLEDPRAAVSIMATGKARFHNRKHHALLRAMNAAKD